MKRILELSVVVPVFNEQENIVPLIDEIVSALDGFVNYEIEYVNDDSIDGTFRGFKTKTNIYSPVTYH